MTDMATHEADDVQSRAVAMLGAYQRGELAADARPVLAHHLRALADQLSPAPTPTQVTLRHALRSLPAAELTLLAFVAAGLLQGHALYGPLYAGKRAWRRESAEERRDDVVYSLADMMDRAGLLPAQGDA